MYTVIIKEKEVGIDTLDEAMAYAKTLNEFVTIKGPDFEVVGMFGVDSVKNGLCPDGIKYDWDKASRIGRVKRSELNANIKTRASADREI